MVGIKNEPESAQGIIHRRRFADRIRALQVCLSALQLADVFRLTTISFKRASLGATAVQTGAVLLTILKRRPREVRSLER